MTIPRLSDLSGTGARVPRRLRALIVEDSPEDRELLLHELTTAFALEQCTFVDSAATFSAALASAEWDVVLSDYSVPEFGAIAALVLLRESGRNIPFIIVSGQISDEQAVALMRLGARDCINKEHLNRIAPAVERELTDGANRREAEIDRDVLLQQLQLQIDRMPIGYVLFDANLAIIDWNRAAQDIFGYTRAEVRGLSSPYHLFVPASADVDMTRLLDRLRRGDMDAQSINENVTKDGRRVVCHWFNTPMMDSAGVFAGLVSMVQDVTVQQRTQRDLRARTEQLRALTASQTLARENERRRVARELHDELGSSLTTLKWDLDHLAAAIGGAIDVGAAAVLRGKIEELAALAQTTMGAVQRIAAELRPGVLDDLGLADAVEWQALEFAKRTHIRCDCSCDVGDAVFTNDQATALFRILQEALTNVVRHAAASIVRISLSLEGGTFVLRVADDGRGLSLSGSGAPTAFGILGMQERAALIGATVDIAGAPGKGTVVSVRLPVGAVPA